MEEDPLALLVAEHKLILEQNKSDYSNKIKTLAEAGIFEANETVRFMAAMKDMTARRIPQTLQIAQEEARRLK